MFGCCAKGNRIADFGDVNPIFIAQISGAREFVEGGFGAVNQDQVLGIDAMDDLGNPDSIGMSR